MLKNRLPIIVLNLVLVSILSIIGYLIYTAADRIKADITELSETLLLKNELMHALHNDIFQLQLSTTQYVNTKEPNLEADINKLIQDNQNRLEVLQTLSNSYQKKALLNQLLKTSQQLSTQIKTTLLLAQTTTRATDYLQTTEIPAFNQLLNLSNNYTTYQIEQNKSKREQLINYLQKANTVLILTLLLFMLFALALARLVYLREKHLLLGKEEQTTQRIKAEHRTLQLSQAIEQSPATVIITDTQGNIEYVNPKFTQISGYTAEEVMGRNPRFLKSGYTPESEYNNLWQKISTGKTWTGEMQNIKKNGELYWENSSISPIINEHGQTTHFLALKEDITQRKKAEEQLHQLNTHLEQKVEERTQQIQQQKNTIEKKNKDLTDSLNYAQHLQKAHYPNIEQLNQTFSDLFLLNKPCEIISGDFCWFHHTPHKTIIACIDCTGHGVPGAFLSIIGMEMLNRITTTQNIQTPETILIAMDHELEKAFNQNLTQHIKDGMDVSICIINHNTQTIQFSGANHPVILVSDNKAITFRGNRFGIGSYIHSSIKVFDSITFNYTPNDMLYLFTDGYRDQFGGTTNKKLGLKPFATLLETIAPSPAHKQKEKLEQNLQIWKGKNHQVDDILVVGLRL